MPSRRFGGYLSLAMLLALTTDVARAATVGDATAGAATVDCDAGDDLAAALEETAAGGPLRLEVVGRCVGRFIVTTPGVRLIGRSPQASIVESDSVGYPAIEVSAPRVIVSDLTVRGGVFGVHVHGNGAFASLLGTSVHDNDVGVLVTEGAGVFFNRTEVFGNDLGVFADDRGEVGGFDSLIRDNSGGGIIAQSGSEVALDDSGISQNGQLGLWVDRASFAELSNVNLSANGQADLLVDDRSRVELRGTSSLGGTGHADRKAVIVRGGSLLSIGDDVTVRGIVAGLEAAHLTVRGARVDGSVQLSGFSTLLLDETEVTGLVLCEAAADAFCGPGAAARTRGCASAPGTCRGNGRPERGPNELPGEAPEARPEHVGPRDVDRPPIEFTPPGR